MFIKVPLFAEIVVKNKIESHIMHRDEEVTEVVISRGSAGGQQMSGREKSIKKKWCHRSLGGIHKLIRSH